MTPRRFLLDADAFITAHRQYYRFSFCPAFWRALLKYHEDKRVASLDQVRRELLRGKDALADWVNSRAPKTFFKETADAAVVKAFSDLSSWVTSRPDLTPEATARFAASADGWLVAYAKANAYVVCTYEVSRPESKANIKLPDAAAFLASRALLPTRCWRNSEYAWSFQSGQVR